MSCRFRMGYFNGQYPLALFWSRALKVDSSLKIRRIPSSMIQREIHAPWSQRLPGVISLGLPWKNYLAICMSDYDSILSSTTVISPTRENDTPLSSTSSSNSDTSLESHSTSPPDLQPADVSLRPPMRQGGTETVLSLWLLPLRASSFDVLDFCSTDAWFDGIKGGTDATNTYHAHIVDDFGFLDKPQVKADATENVWDNGVDYGTVGGEYNGMGTIVSSQPIAKVVIDRLNETRKQYVRNKSPAPNHDLLPFTLHPPGASLAALSGWYQAYYEVFCEGLSVQKLEELHKIYGTSP
ncbi:hypothetical protein ARMSODRAFT_983961 [Armillaria solidipes]|uniref:Uncharacterized protein n=1 Tax=Armillaria solidipes TaxID=1076256 RepID=A0A2H3B5H4_9AGAR|nr:hypothetical protein ARMSODRAFT_983961 [Armillaria solidipes]